jgi:hypothetical protein
LKVINVSVAITNGFHEIRKRIPEFVQNAKARTGTNQEKKPKGKRKILIRRLFFICI